METIPVISLGAAAFWISLAAVLIAGGYWKVRSEARRHETLLRLVERTGQLDEQQVKLLFPPPPPHPPMTAAAAARHSMWTGSAPAPGEARKAWLVLGVILLSLAVGLTVFFAVVLNAGTAPQKEGVVWGFGWAGLIACVGIGFLVASRFCSRAEPRDRDGGQAP